MLEKKRDLMANLLTDVGFKPTIPEGGYFMMADTSDIGNVFQQIIVHNVLLVAYRGCWTDHWVGAMRS